MVQTVQHSASAYGDSRPRLLALPMGYIYLATLALYAGLTIIPQTFVQLSHGEMWAIRSDAGSHEFAPYQNPAIAILLAGFGLGLALNIRKAREVGAKEMLAAGGLFITALVLMLIAQPGEEVGKTFNLAVCVGLFFTLIAFWLQPDSRISWIARWASIFLYVVLIVSFVRSGTDGLRWVGAMQPNHFGRNALCALFLAMIATRRLPLLPFLLTLVLCLLVSSRTNLVGALFIGICYVAFMREGQRQIGKLAFAGLVSLCAILVETITSGYILQALAERLDIFSDLRGVDSGFTGRTERWALFFQSSEAEMILGRGFRSAKYDGLDLHSGMLSYMFDFGLILGVMLIAGLIAKGVMLMRRGRARGDNLAQVAGLFVITSLLIQISEPDYFSIGFFGSVMFMLALAYPLGLLAARKRLG